MSTLVRQLMAAAVLGHHHQAIRIGTAVLAAKYKSNNLHGVAELANDLGTSYRHLQRLTEAMESHRTALAIADTVGELHVRAAALNELALTLIVGGRASEALGRHRKALGRHRKALALATRIGHPYEQGRALDGIAGCLVDTDPAEA
ncbi:MAG: tetratricopeptide repeat protein, partial [Mycobacteriaceae bacterium]